MRRAVILQHRLPDGSAHFDWLCERATGADPQTRCLIAFRVDRRVDQCAQSGFIAKRIDDHRRLYLDYEGSVAGGRGEVVRVAAGAIADLDEREHSIRIAIDWGAGPVQYTGASASGEASWRFTVCLSKSR